MLGVRSFAETPTNAYATRPCSTSCRRERFAELIGTANPTPSKPLPLSLLIWALIPMTSPRALNNGPPELPLLMGASVWIASTSAYADVRAGEHEPVPRDEEAGALRGGCVAAARAEDRIDRDDAVRALAVDARRLESIRKRPGDLDRPGRLRERRLAHDDGCGHGLAEPAFALAEPERGGGAERGSDKGDRGDGTRAHVEQRSRDTRSGNAAAFSRENRL